MVKPTLKFQPGYTLIEILVAISILVVLFSLGLASFGNFNNQKMLVRAKDELKTALRQASSKAKNNEKDCSSSKCGGADGLCGTTDDNTSPLEGWYVDITNRRIYGQCGSTSPYTEFGSKDIFTFLSNLQVSSDHSLIKFEPLTGKADNAVTITLSLQGESIPNQILLVDPSGNVSE